MPYAMPEAQRAYQREWIARRRAEWFVGKACVDCGTIEALEIDHVDPERKIDHRVWSWAQARRDAELAKCVVRCRACHDDRHAPDKTIHGTTTCYRAGCRCSPCREANAKRARVQYAARRAVGWRRPRG